jgi:hypothetical protein
MYILIGGQAINAHIDMLPENYRKKAYTFRPPSESGGDVDVVDPRADVSQAKEYLTVARRIDDLAYLDFTVNKEKVRDDSLVLVLDPYPVIALPRHDAEIFPGYVGPIKVYNNDKDKKIKASLNLGNKKVNTASLNTLIATQLNPAAFTDSRLTKIVIGATADFINQKLAEDSQTAKDSIVAAFDSAATRIINGEKEIDGIVKRVYRFIDYNYLRSIHPLASISFAFRENSSEEYKENVRKIANKIQNREKKQVSIASRIDGRAGEVIKEGLGKLIEALKI